MENENKERFLSEEIREPKKNNSILLIVLFAGILIMAYLWFSKTREYNNCVENNTTLENDMKGMNDMLSGYTESLSNDLKSDFKNMLATYDALKEKDASKADSINAQKAKIEGLLQQLNQNKKLTAQQIYTLKKENETLRNIMKGYVKQIDSLNTLNLELTYNLETRTSELNTTIQERDQAKQVASEKDALVKKGSKLQVVTIKSNGLRMKLSNTVEETNKAKSVSQVRSLFTIGANPIASSGDKTVYMQIIAPDGKTLQSKNSGTVQTDLGNIAYSDKKDISYENEKLDVAIYYFFPTDEKAESGTYKVKIFCDGQLIGNDSFTLK